MAKDVLKRKNEATLSNMTLNELTWELARVAKLRNFNKSSRTRYVKHLSTSISKLKQALNLIYIKE
jgi:hypothetical protein